LPLPFVIFVPFVDSFFEWKQLSLPRFASGSPQDKYHRGPVWAVAFPTIRSRLRTFGGRGREPVIPAFIKANAEIILTGNVNPMVSVRSFFTRRIVGRGSVAVFVCAANHMMRAEFEFERFFFAVVLTGQDIVLDRHGRKTLVFNLFAVDLGVGDGPCSVDFLHGHFPVIRPPLADDGKNQYDAE
jgi:hypothetical protein